MMNIMDSILWNTDPESTVKVTMPTYASMKDVKHAIEDYDDSRVFTDEILLDLLSENIGSLLEKETENIKRQIEKDKRNMIDDFISTIKHVSFQEENGVTIVYWTDGSKTVVRCQKGDIYNKEAGLALCIIKRLFGNTNYFNEIFKSVLEKEAANATEKNTSVKKKKKAFPKKRKRFPSQDYPF